MIIIVTGKHGSGKSVVARQIAKQGYTLIDADQIGHALHDLPSIRAKLVGAFGEGILIKNKVSRVNLGEAAFSSTKELEKLNKIMHPPLTTAIHLRARGNCVIDAALFSELKLEKITDVVIEVKRPKEGTRAFFQKTLSWTHFLIINNGDIPALCSATDALLAEMKRKAY
ncbi:MAG: dephospho-CoA kinase [Nanoarchaeota archaeon]